MTSLDENSPKASWYRRSDIAVLLFCSVTLIGLLIPAIHAAREAQRRMESANNLKQLGLAMHNYESVFKRLAIGADRDASGLAHHGWFTRIHPVIEASAWPMYVDPSLAWDHPCNSYLFMEKRSCVLRPGVSGTYTPEGFGLTHTMGNPNILNAGRGVRFAELASGLDHSWFFGEVEGRYQPWGYPYNWRKLTWPLNAGDGGYGGWHDGAQFCLADGSVRFIANDVDRDVLEQLANAPPIASAEDTAMPLRHFDVAGDRAAWKREFFAVTEFRPTKGGTGTTIIYTPDGVARVATLRFTPEETIKIGLDLDAVIQHYPTLRILLVGDLNDADAKKVATLRELETLIVRRLELSDIGLASLRSLPKLKHLSLGNAECDLPLSEALPDCEIHFRLSW